MLINYPRIERPKAGATAMTAPGFPQECPGCKAKRVALIGSKPEERQAKYACGGMYSPIDSGMPNRNAWAGTCGAPEGTSLGVRRCFDPIEGKAWVEVDEPRPIQF